MSTRLGDSRKMGVSFRLPTRQEPGVVVGRLARNAGSYLSEKGINPG